MSEFLIKKTITPNEQISILEQLKKPSFSEKLNDVGKYPLKPDELEILQVNLGKMCNQTCSHCHVDAGPHRKEIMDKKVMEQILSFIKKHDSIKTVDLTGGAPEMNPDFLWFVEQLYNLKKEIIVRSNLTILVANKKYRNYPEYFKQFNVRVVSSLPCYTKENTDKQRGDGVFNSSIEALKILNDLGYGKPGTNLILDLVFNPGGASLAASQESLEKDYKQQLKAHFGIEFNRLFTINNLPISRFLEYLLENNKYEQYLNLLVENFNPNTVDGVMCRNTLSVGWDGKLYDCDFNQMLEKPVLTSKHHISDVDIELLKDRAIWVNNHCYGCTAGAGSSCQGALV